MEKTEIIYLVVCMGLFNLITGIALAWFIEHKIMTARKKLVEYHEERFTTHQNWLFNQLYSMAPGKVLLPDEFAPDEEEKPAIVINTNRDPMNEFNGKKDDWF